jgi:c-di-GMP-binding flagellar brake protein YcgR
MEFDYSDRRKHQRVDIQQAIYVEVVKRGSRSEADNTIIRCETADISAAGLKVWFPIMVAQGTRLNIAVPMEGWKENLELIGQAMWVRDAEEKDEGYWVGLELEDSSLEDMQKWFKVVHRLKG